MTTQESHPLHTLPTAQSARLIDFDTANVITLMIYPPRPTLVVGGTLPDPAMTVTLVPRAYMRRPEYWGIEVVGSATGVGGHGVPVPYSVELSLDGIVGTAGIEVIGATRTERLRLATEDATQFVGAVEAGRFRPLFPSWVDDEYLRLTTVGAKEDTRPEAGEIELAGYDGSLLRVLGQYGDGWIYSTTVVEQVRDSILSIVARQVLTDRAQDGST
jgi:hypothetical protein